MVKHHVPPVAAADQRIWAGDHPDAPVARAGGLLEAEEDHGSQLGEGHHEGAQVAAHADVVRRAHLLDDVIVIVHRTVVLALPWPCRGDAPQRHRTLLGRHGNLAAIWRDREVTAGLEEGSDRHVV